MRIKTVVCALLTLLFLNANNALAIPGFKEYKIKPGDTYSLICKKELSEFNREILYLLMKVNRTDVKHLIPGRIIYLPVDMELARAYCPVPKIYEEFILNPRGVYIDLSKQCFGAYEFGRLIFWGPISSGKKGHETPTGNFKVLYKTRYRISKKYKAPMPFSIQFSGHYFSHQFDMVGWPASHGCVRLLMNDAEKLYYWAYVGDPIFVRKDTLVAVR